MNYKRPDFGRFLSYDTEAIADIIYDRETYPVGPDWEIRFFENPVGVNGKTEADTSMYLRNQLPTGQRFIASAVEIVFLPHPSLTKRKRIADINAAARSGLVTLQIQNRRYMQTAPLASCPAASYWHEDRQDEPGHENTRAHIRAQLSEQFRETDYGAFGGRPFLMTPLMIEGTQFFVVSVRNLARLPSRKDGALYCRIPGRLFRQLS